MATGAKTGFVSGAAQGAAAGASFGPWGAVIGAGVGGLLGYVGGREQDKMQANRDAWAKYNNEVQHATNMYNIEAAQVIASFNAQSIALKAGADAKVAYRNATYNAGLILATTQFNQSLLETELENVWQDMDLDLEQLEFYKLREKGAIIASQAASGTVIGEGSNEDVVVSQQAQRMLDAEIIKFGADRRAATIQNEMAKSSWEGQIAIDRTLWEGQIAGFQSRSSAALTAGSILTESAIRTAADKYSADQAYEVGKSGIAMDRSSYNSAQTQAMVQGLFRAGGMAAQNYYSNKTPGPGTSLATG